jgi:formyltetrahydrofolate-dependent phosphoribosylglycinamide formyltransferase
VNESLIAYTDGGSRGNPGPAGAAFVLTTSDNRSVLSKAFFLGQATNNVAEYTALIKALESAKELEVKNLLIRADSELMVRQLKGEYKVKAVGLMDLYSQAMALLSGFCSWSVEHIRREYNSKADALANRAMDLKHDLTEFAPKPAGKKASLGILLSGGGRTMLNINDQIKSGQLNAEIACVISSRCEVLGVERAKKIGHDVNIVRRKDHDTIESFSKQIENILTEANVNLVIQAGWLCLWNIPARFENAVMNIHPALLPSFGGQGMWGHHVHEAVLKAGCKISGCTVHFCTNEYDKGPIIVQKSCPVMENDTPDTLAERVFGQECIAYPEAIKLFSQERLKVHGNVVRIKG